MKSSIKKSPLLDLIPKDELRLKLSYGHSELEGDFLGFDNVYLPIAELVPKDFVIVDLGCYQAAQCYAFAEHEKYVGVDYYDLFTSSKYVPPLRFCAPNACHYVMSIEDFMSDKKQHFDPDKSYWIMSYVPAFADNPGWLLDQVKHGCFVYCKTIRTKGIFAEEIKAKIESYPLSQ